VCSVGDFLEECSLGLKMIERPLDGAAIRS
jgi:hypothetical protein